MRKVTLSTDLEDLNDLKLLTNGGDYKVQSATFENDGTITVELTGYMHETEGVKAHSGRYPWHDEDEDYKEQLQSEYWKTKYRRDKLEREIDEINVGMLDYMDRNEYFKCKCHVEESQFKLMNRQLCVMDRYLKILRERAILIGLDL